METEIEIVSFHAMKLMGRGNSKGHIYTWSLLGLCPLCILFPFNWHF